MVQVIIGAYFLFGFCFGWGSKEDKAFVKIIHPNGAVSIQTKRTPEEIKGITGR